MVGRYRIWPEGFAAHMRPAKPVDMVFADEHDAEIADIKAERALAERAGGVRFVGNIPGSSSASGFAPLTTEPAAPEGRQEEVALTYGQKLIAEAIEHHFGERGQDFDEYDGDTTVSDAWEAFDALTRPSEQAVTEAMVEAEWHGDPASIPFGEKVTILAVDWSDPDSRKACWVRWWPEECKYPSYRSCDLSDISYDDEALKAAMEAGRHD